MFIQISSGQGPVECQRAVWLVYKRMQKVYSDLDLVDWVSGHNKNCYRSLIFMCKSEQTFTAIKSNWLGSVQWRGESPFRPGHRRKNWFVKISHISLARSEVFDPAKVELEAFRAGGPGGQHVNKTSTAVRAVYIPTGDIAICSDQRSQFQNRQVALLKLKQILEERNSSRVKEAESENRMLHYQLERGNPVQSFSGKL